MKKPAPETAVCADAPSRPDGQPILTLSVAAMAVARTRFAPLQPSAATTLTPEAAMTLLEEWQQEHGGCAGVEMSGPGDPLASIDISLASLRLIAGKYPGLPLSLITLGIGGEKHAGQLKAAGLKEMQIQVEAIDPLSLERIYLWIRPGRKTLPLPEAARILVDEQRRAIVACKQAGLTVLICTTVYPDRKSDHLEAIAKAMASYGADGMRLEPCPPLEEAEGNPAGPDATMMAEAERICRRHLPVSAGSARPRDAGLEPERGQGRLRPTGVRPNVAVASSSGMDVDLHLGQASQLLIYGPRGDGLICLLESRPAPKAGGAGSRWQDLAARLTDCFALLAASAGETPRAALAQEGISVLITEDGIAEKVDVLYGGGKKGKGCRR